MRVNHINVTAILVDELPEMFTLKQNYPNPFNPETTIKFYLRKASQITLEIYNILGEVVTTLVLRRLAAETYSYEWDASSLVSSVYVYGLRADNYVEMKKMVLIGELLSDSLIMITGCYLAASCFIFIATFKRGYLI
jgi:Secretion system C-terminal sorting domain